MVVKMLNSCCFSFSFFDAVPKEMLSADNTSQIPSMIVLTTPAFSGVWLGQLRGV
jgi:hypothetical protein